MNRVKFLIFTLGIVMAGCIPSLHPLYTNKDVVYDPKLVGVWSDSNDTGIWEFRPAPEPNSYTMIYTDKDKKAGAFSVHLTKLDGMLFLDVFPNEPNLPYNGFYNLHLQPVHTFMKVDQIEPILKMRFMDVDKFAKRLEKEPHLLRHEVMKDGSQQRIVLTASTKELQAFMLKHANDEGVFSKPSNMKRITPPDK